MSRRTRWLLGLALCLAVLSVASTQARDLYVAPDGAPDGAATREVPLDLASALRARTGARPGDTVLLMAGTYAGAFTSYVDGEEARPVIIRAADGDRAVIDVAGQRTPALTIRGQWTTVRDIELTNSDPDRTLRLGRRPNGIDVFGAHARLINLIVHDAGTGINLWSQAHDAEVSGCIVYYNGWVADRESHGHGILARNDSGSQKLANNIVFDQCGDGMRVEANAGQLVRVLVEGNAIYNNGTLSANPLRAANLLVGGWADKVSGVEVVDNAVYQAPGGRRAGCQFGATGENRGLVLRRNVIVGPVRIDDWQSATVMDNLFVGFGTLVELRLPKKVAATDYTWRQNHYVAEKSLWYPFGLYDSSSGAGLDWSDWRRKSGIDVGSRFEIGRPRGLRVIVRRNENESGRGHVVVYNWDEADQVGVRPTGILSRGDRYGVWLPDDLWGRPLVSGEYDGSPIVLPMTAPRPTRPVGDLPGTPTPAGREFGVFVIRRIDASAAKPAPQRTVEPAATRETQAAPSPAQTDAGPVEVRPQNVEPGQP